jgi:hypothetical protein
MKRRVREIARRNFLKRGIMLYFIGFLLFLLTLIFLTRAVLFCLTGVRAVGKVVELVPDTEDDNLFAPVVEYMVEGAVYKFRHSTFYKNSPYKLGAPVALLYSPRNPQRAAIKSLGMFFVPVCLALGTIVVFIAAPLV